MITAVDTPVLLDVLVAGAVHARESEARLAEAMRAGPLVICPVVAADLGACFSREAELRAFLHDTGLRLDPFSPATLFTAGQVWRSQSRRFDRPVCHSCGARAELICPRCGSALAPIPHVIGGYLVGAHALLQADRLLTRQRAFYATCFPKLRLAP